jgi:hypothetical protein
VHVDLISKHGSDGIHGLVYYKRGSSAFNAKSYFDTQKSAYKLSEVQGELGGALIPRWTYFYAGAMYQKTPFSETLYADVPTAQMRSLDFSQFMNPQTAPNGKVVVIRDPRTGVPFPNNVIPSSRLALVSSKYLTNYFPAPNAGAATAFTQNYSWNHPYGSDTYVGNWPFGRIDQRISANTQVYFRWMQNQTASIPSGSIGEQLSATQTARYRGYIFSGVTAISSSLANQISVGSTTVRVKQGESESKFNPLHGDSVVSALGIQGVNPNNYQVMGFPSVSISGLTGLAMPFGGGHDKDIAANDQIKTFQDSLTWSHGRHSVNFGGAVSELPLAGGSRPAERVRRLQLHRRVYRPGVRGFCTRVAEHQHAAGRQTGSHASSDAVRPVSQRLVPSYVAADAGFRSALGLLHDACLRRWVHVQLGSGDRPGDGGSGYPDRSQQFLPEGRHRGAGGCRAEGEDD